MLQTWPSLLERGLVRSIVGDETCRCLSRILVSPARFFSRSKCFSRTFLESENGRSRRFISALRDAIAGVENKYLRLKLARMND